MTYKILWRMKKKNQIFYYETIFPFVGIRSRIRCIRNRNSTKRNNPSKEIIQDEQLVRWYFIICSLQMERIKTISIGWFKVHICWVLVLQFHSFVSSHKTYESAKKRKSIFLNNWQICKVTIAESLGRLKRP